MVLFADGDRGDRPLAGRLIVIGNQQ